MNWIYFIIIGILAGFLAGQVIKGGGLGLIGDLVVGVIGSLLGAWVLGWLGFSLGGGLIGSLATAFIGACLLLVLFRIVSK